MTTQPLWPLHSNKSSCVAEHVVPVKVFNGSNATIFPSIPFQLRECVALVNPGVSQLSLRDDGKLLASAGWDHRVRVFGWKRLRPLAVLQYHTDMVLSVAFSDHQDHRQRLLAAGSKDQRISLWSIYNERADTGWTSELRGDILTFMNTFLTVTCIDGMQLLFWRYFPALCENPLKMKNWNTLSDGW